MHTALSHNRMPGLDLMRAWAILWVMLFHTRGLLPPILDQVGRFGWMGVDIFFVLSGFLIGTQLLRPYANGQRPSFTRFYLSRAFRILPAYAVVLALYFLVPAFREAPEISPLSHFLTFTENFRIDYFNVQAFSHVWSLCVEEHFYMLLPLVAFVMMKRPSAKAVALLALGILFVGLGTRAYQLHALLPIRAEDLDDFLTLYIEKIYYPTYTRLDGLLVGVLLACVNVFRPGWWQRVTGFGHGLLVASLVAVTAAIWMFQDRFGAPATVIGFPLLEIGFGLLLIYSVSPRSLLAETRIIGAGAIASLAYSLYLTHKAVVHLDRTYLTQYVQGRGAFSLIVYGVSVFAAGALLCWCVERPFLRLRSRVLSTHSASSLSAAASAAAEQQKSYPQGTLSSGNRHSRH